MAEKFLNEAFESLDLWHALVKQSFPEKKETKKNDVLANLCLLGYSWLEENIISGSVRFWILDLLVTNLDRFDKNEYTTTEIFECLKEDRLNHVIEWSVSRPALIENVKFLAEHGFVRTKLKSTTHTKERFTTITERGHTIFKFYKYLKSNQKKGLSL